MFHVQRFGTFGWHLEYEKLKHNNQLYSGGGAYHRSLVAMVTSWDFYTKGKGKLLEGLKQKVV